MSSLPKDKEEKLIRYIKKFVDKHGFGPRSEDIINKFVPSSWSSKSSLFYHLGKLIDCRNLDKRADPEKAGDHYLRYFINETYDKEAKKIELAMDLKEQELNKLNTVKVSKEEMEKALIKLAEAYRNQSINRSTFWKANKLWNSYKNLFLNFCEEDLRKKGKFWDIFIQHPLGVPSPDLSLEDKFAILKVLSRLAAARSPIEDIKKRSFTIILSYNPILEEDSEEEIQERLKRKTTAWKKDKGIKKMTTKHLEKMREDEIKMKKLYIEGIRKWYESLD